jgi:hypothetical protein
MKNILLASALVLISGSAFGAEIGPAGCGLGHQLMGKDSQVLASTTNGTSGNQTFGISSGTSDCAGTHSSAAIMNYIETNKTALVKEAARGEGETIAGLSKMMGCEDAKAFGSSMKSRYQTIFPTQDAGAAHVTVELRRMMNEEKTLATRCAPIS